MRKRMFVIVLLLMALGLAAEGKQEAELVQSFEIEGVRRLIVERGSVFDVEIDGYSGDSVKVEVYATTDDEVAQSRRGSDAVITYRGEIGIRAIGSVRRFMMIRVPSRTALDVRTSTGDISVESVTGEKSLESSTGDISVRSSNGDVVVRSTTGDQRYNYVEGSIRGQSSTGSIELANVTGKVEVVSTTGRQTGRAVKITADSSFTTSTGRIEIDFANPVSELRFELESSSGLITLGDSEVRGELVSGEGSLRVRGKSTTGKQTYQ